MSAMAVEVSGITIDLPWTRLKRPSPTRYRPDSEIVVNPPRRRDTSPQPVGAPSCEPPRWPPSDLSASIAVLPGLSTMKIVSFNINGLRARPHQLAALIEKHQPDVIGLQET